MKPAASAAALLTFVALGVVIAAIPMPQQQALTSDQQILLTLDNLQTVDAMLWGTLDTFSISTQVATLTAPTSLPSPTSTPPPTNTPRPTQTASSTPTASLTAAFPTPTQEVVLATWTRTPTFAPGTNTYTPTATIDDYPTATPETEYTQSRGIQVVATAGLNVRWCPSTECEREPQPLPRGHYSDVWADSCGHYTYVKGLGYWKVDSGDYVWCKLNVSGTGDYWIAIQYRDQVWAAWWDGVDAP